MAREKSPIDRHVGRRVYMRRNAAGVTQRQLADAIGVTYQQLQKYERGENRIGPSRLYGIAQALGVPLSYFFEGVEEAVRGAPAEPTAPLEPPPSIMDGIPDGGTRRAIAALCRAVAQSKRA